MVYPDSNTLAIIAKYPKIAYWANLRVLTNAKMVDFKYRGSQSLSKGSNRTIITEAVNIWGSWFTKHEIEACLTLNRC